MSKHGTIEGLGYIYRYLSNGETVYVGQTINLDRRIKEHSEEIKFHNLTEIEFQGCLRKDLNDIEAYYIALYKPILNKTSPKIKNNNINNIIEHLLGWEKYKIDSTINKNIIDIDTINKNSYLTVKEAARIKNVSTQAIYKRINNGTIPVVNIDGLQYVPKQFILSEILPTNEEKLAINSHVNNNIILFLLDALDEQQKGLKEQYIQRIKKYFGVIINE